MQDNAPNPWPARAGYAALGLGAATAAMAAATRLLARDAEARVPADGRHLDVEGARLHYTDAGSGPAIVMIHGLGGQLRNFSYALTSLLERNHRIVVVDRPGSGYSTPRPGPAPDIRAQGRLVARLIEKLGLDRPLLVGHSLGGAVSLAAALAAPGRIGGLALLAPLTQPLDQAPEALRRLQRDSKLSRGFLAQVVGVPIGRLTAPAALKAIFAPDPVPADFPVRGGGLLALRPGNIDANSFEISASRDDLHAMVPRYGELRLPVSILFGRQDNLLDPEVHGRLTASQIEGAELELVDGGHMLPVNHADDCARLLRATSGRIGGR